MGRPGGRSELREKSVCLEKEKRVIRNETGGADHTEPYVSWQGVVFLP